MRAVRDARNSRLKELGNMVKLVKLFYVRWASGQPGWDLSGAAPSDLGSRTGSVTCSTVERFTLR